MNNDADIFDHTGGTMTLQGTNYWADAGAYNASGTAEVRFNGNTTMYAPTWDFVNLTIYAARTFNQNNIANINVTGNWLNSGGTYTHNNKKVTFNGTGMQQITNPSGERFYDLTIANSGTVQLNNDITVANQVDLTAIGSLDLSASSLTISNWDDGNIPTLGTDKFFIANGTDAPTGAFTDVAVEASGGKVELAWVGKIDFGVDFFTIEHSTDGENFVEIGTVSSVGSSDSPYYYGFTHAAAPYGRNHYRLSRTSENIKTSVCKTIAVDVTTAMPVSSSMNLFPDPMVNNHTLTVEFSNPGGVGNNMLIEVLTLMGKRVVAEIFRQEEESGTHTMESVYGLEPGVYFVIASCESSSFKRMLVIN